MDPKRRPRDTSKMSADVPDFLKTHTSIRMPSARRHSPMSSNQLSRLRVSPDRGERSRTPDSRSLRRQRVTLSEDLRQLKAQVAQLEDARRAAVATHQGDVERLTARIRTLQEKSKAGLAKVEDQQAVEQATLRLYEDFMAEGSPPPPDGSAMAALERIGTALQATIREREAEKAHLQRTLLAIQQTQDAAAHKQQDTLASLRAEADAAVQEASQDDSLGIAQQAAKLEELNATIVALEAERKQLQSAVGSRERDCADVREASALREALLIAKERHTVAYANMEQELLDNRVSHATESVKLRQEATKTRDKTDKEALVFFKIQAENTRMQQELRRLRAQVQAARVELGRSKVPVYEAKLKEVGKKAAEWEKEKPVLQRQLEELQQQHAEVAEVNARRQDEYQRLAQALEVDQSKREKLGDELFLTQSRVWQETDLPARHWKQTLQRREAEVESLSKRVTKSVAEGQREHDQHRLEVEVLWETLQEVKPDLSAQPGGLLLRVPPPPPRDALRPSSPNTSPKDKEPTREPPPTYTPRSGVTALLAAHPDLEEVIQAALASEPGGDPPDSPGLDHPHSAP